MSLSEPVSLGLGDAGGSRLNQADGHSRASWSTVLGRAPNGEGQSIARSDRRANVFIGQRMKVNLRSPLPTGLEIARRLPPAKVNELPLRVLLEIGARELDPVRSFFDIDREFESCLDAVSFLHPVWHARASLSSLKRNHDPRRRGIDKDS